MIVGGLVPPWQFDEPQVPGPVLSKRGNTSVFQLTAQLAVPPLDEVPPLEEVPPEDDAVPDEEPDDDAVPDDEAVPLDEPDDELPEDDPLPLPLPLLPLLEDELEEELLDEEEEPAPGCGAWRPTRPFGGP